MASSSIGRLQAVLVLTQLDDCGQIAPFFFFNDTATTEIYTLSLHDALPISSGAFMANQLHIAHSAGLVGAGMIAGGDRKSTRLNSSHPSISYAVFCLKKKKRPPFGLREGF